MTNQNDVPPEYRVYIGRGDVDYYSQHGVKVYHGSRGGLYVDLREVQRKGLGYVGSKDKEIDVDKEDVILNLVRNDVKYRSEYLSVIGMVRKNIVHGIRESIQEGGVGKKYKKGADVISATNRVIDSFDSADLTKNPVDVIDFKELGVRGGAHSAGMKIFVFDDGSKVYAKRINDDRGERYYLLNNIFGSAVLKAVGKAVSPVGRIVKDEDGIYVGVSEVYGVDINTFGYGIDAIERAVDSGFIKLDDNFIESLVSGMIIGLTDTYVHNFMIDTDSNRVVFYDIDFTNNDSSDIIYLLKWFEGNGYVDEEKVGSMFLNIWRERKDDIKCALDEAYLYVQKSGVVDSNELDEIYSEWKSWFDDVENLINEVGEDYYMLGVVLMSGGWRK